LPLILAFACSLQAGIISTSGDITVVPTATADYTANPFNDPDPAPIRLLG
jgi:hypothetical protein